MTSTGIPFARLDSILLLVKRHLRGPIPEMLNAKDNQVFLDYLAGGQNSRIAVERAANAQSGGVLSVAARNAAGLPEGGGATMWVTEEQLALIKDARQELVTVQTIAGALQSELAGLAGTLREVKQGYAEFADVKIHYAQKEHEQKIQFAEEIQAFEQKKRKQNMELDEEEAVVAERCRAIREGKRQQLMLERSEEHGEEEEEIVPVDFNNDDLAWGNEPGLKYNYEAEAGMGKEEVEQRRGLWKQLEAMGAEKQERWQALAEEHAVVSPAMAAYETQLRERLSKYEAMEEAEADNANAQRRAYLRKVSCCWHQSCLHWQD